MSAEFRFRLRLMRRRANLIVRQIAIAGVLTVVAFVFLAAAIWQGGTLADRQTPRSTMAEQTLAR